MARDLSHPIPSYHAFPFLNKTHTHTHASSFACQVILWQLLCLHGLGLAHLLFERSASVLIFQLLYPPSVVSDWVSFRHVHMLLRSFFKSPWLPLQNASDWEVEFEPWESAWQMGTPKPVHIHHLIGPLCDVDKRRVPQAGHGLLHRVHLPTGVQLNAGGGRQSGGEGRSVCDSFGKGFTWTRRPQNTWATAYWLTTIRKCIINRLFGSHNHYRTSNEHILNGDIDQSL